MITYSDTIMARHPTIWCPMDSEPVELATGSCYFLDYSGNKFHNHVRIAKTDLDHYDPLAFQELGLGGLELDEHAESTLENLISSGIYASLVSYQQTIKPLYSDEIVISTNTEPAWDPYGNRIDAPYSAGIPNAVTHMHTEFLFRDLVLPRHNIDPGTYWCQLFSVACFSFVIIATWVREELTNQLILNGPAILAITITRYNAEPLNYHSYKNIIFETPIDIETLSDIRRVSFDYELDTWRERKIKFEIALDDEVLIRSSYDARTVIQSVDLSYYSQYQIENFFGFQLVEPFSAAFHSNCTISALSFIHGTTFQSKNIHPDDQSTYDSNFNTSIQSFIEPASTYWDDNYTGIDLESPTETILNSTEINANNIDHRPGTMILQFNRFMIDGTCQSLVRQIDVQFSQQNNCYQVFLIFKSIEIGCCHFTNIKKGDWIELGRSNQPGLNRKWKVYKVYHNSISFLTERNDFIFEDCYDKIVVVKKIAIRDTGSYLPETFSWTKEGNHLSCTFQCVEDSRSFTLNDQSQSRITQLNSDDLYIKRNMKNDIQIDPYYLIFSNWNDEIYQWRVIGTPRQLYLSLGYARDEIDFHLLLTIGSIKDFFSNTWEFVLQGYKTNSYGNPGETLAYSYPVWTILSTGHLLCRHKNDENTLNSSFFLSDFLRHPLSNSSDLGCRIYPNPFLKIEEI